AAPAVRDDAVYIPTSPNPVPALAHFCQVQVGHSSLAPKVCNTMQNKICQGKYILKIFSNPNTEYNYQNFRLYIIFFKIFSEKRYICMI
ncbi:MAG: hypothetical protein ACYCPO_06830, partial [Acidobacteriaceae bacterium]